jgi:hypothetical protein
MMAAYVLSMVAAVFKTAAQNHALFHYTNFVVKQLETEPGKNTIANREEFSSWMSGESSNTLADTVEMITEGTSTALNLFITFTVFAITIGPLISAVLFVALMLSVSLVRLVRQRVEILATETQSSYLKVGTHLRPLWDSIFFATQEMLSSSKVNHHTKLKSYFSRQNSYTVLEQLLAAVPIVVTVPLIILATSKIDPQNLVYLGVIVAILPRSLQLLGNVHALSILQTQYVYTKSKYLGLINFIANLQTINFENHVDFKRIKIGFNHRIIDPKLAMANLANNEIQFGRLLVQGDNGSGKMNRPGIAGGRFI